MHSYFFLELSPTLGPTEVLKTNMRKRRHLEFAQVGLGPINQTQISFDKFVYPHFVQSERKKDWALLLLFR